MIQSLQQNYTNRRMLPGVIPARANSEMLPREESTPSLTMISLPGLTWFWVRFSMTEETGQDICLTDIRSRRLITLCSTVRKALVPALWVTRFSKAQTEAFQRSRVVNCIPRQWLPAFRCTPAGSSATLRVIRGCRQTAVKTSGIPGCTTQNFSIQTDIS